MPSQVFVHYGHFVSMKTGVQKAFDFAAETTKQLITLSTAIITLTITFSKDIVGVSKLSNTGLLFWSWIFFIFSIFFGVWTLLALTGSLQPKKSEKIKNKHCKKVQKTEQSIYSNNIKLPSGLQITTFLVGLGFTVCFGYSLIK